MKLLLLLGFIGLSAAARAQSPALPPPLPGLPFDSLTHAPTYRGVVTVPGQPAAELQARAREWVALTFQDAHQVTQLDDPARGVLIGRGFRQVNTNPAKDRLEDQRLISFTFRLDFRDGRYRYELRDLGSPDTRDLITNANASSGSIYSNDLLTSLFQWQTSASGTLTSSVRQRLMSAGRTGNYDDYGYNGELKKSWPQTAAILNAGLLDLLNSLAQHERTPAAKW